MIKRRILEVLLEEARVPIGGFAAAGESRHILTVSLVWPRMAIAHKTAVRTAVLREGVYRPDAASWTERVLFKEAVEGPFGIRIDVSEAMSAAQWTDALARLGGAVWTMAGARLLEFTDVPAAALLWRAPFDAAARAAAAAGKNDPRPVASGSLDMRCDEWPPLREKRVSVALAAPAEIGRVTRRRAAGKLQAQREVILRAGQPNGEAVLWTRVYS